MNVLLKDFQVEYVDILVDEIRRAQDEVRGGGRAQAIWLSSPTGSGKTIMATAAIERLIVGDEKIAGDAEMTILWISDQPELNEQTRSKMIDHSTVFDVASLISIESTFEQDSFTTGCVYFLNIQKLGKNSSLVQSGDRRTTTIWQTVAATVEARPSKFIVFIDEAHRGMQERPQQRQEALTIIQKFIKGSDELRAIPLVAGMSATPKRFEELVKGTNRIPRHVDVDVLKVKASGLLKDRIRVEHPERRQTSDITMLGEATRKWRLYWERWQKYCEAQGDDVVKPILVVQVEDGTKGAPSRTDLAEAVRVITKHGASKTDKLTDASFAHSFQEGTTVDIGAGRGLRYLAPSKIDDDLDVRVVFFKTALNTGWDCPRAETMMSFRKAIDATAIAQLVGRMVRAPLARRVDSDRLLNKVFLYLPHFDAQGLAAVVKKLNTGEDGGSAAVDVEVGDEYVTLKRARASKKFFDRLAQLPSYVVPRTRKANQVKRLMKLSRLLTHDDIDPDAIAAATEMIVDALELQFQSARKNKEFIDRVADARRVALRQVEMSVTGELEDESQRQMALASEDVQRAFEDADHRLGDNGFNIEWYNRHMAGGDVDGVTAKLEIVTLLADDVVIERVQDEAMRTTERWLGQHRKAISALVEGRRQKYGEVAALATRPVIQFLDLPPEIDARAATKMWLRHMYVDGNSKYPADLNGWETPVVTAELARPDVKAWFRNVPKQSWAFTIPYKKSGEWAPMFPDFVFFHVESDGTITVDLLEPHHTGLSDAPEKAVGLADYAEQHKDEFARIAYVVIDKKQIKGLDMKDPVVRRRVRAIQQIHELQELLRTDATPI